MANDSSIEQAKPQDAVGWSNAIADAKVQLAKAEYQVVRLKAAIMTFQDNLRDGLPFPKK
mgnify:CR=1 FL=1